MLSALRRNQLKIQIDSIQTGLERFRNHLIDQVFPLGCITQYLVSLIIRIDPAVEIPQHTPYVQIGLVRIVHILRRRNRSHIAVRIANAEPGGSDRRQSLRIRNGFQHKTVGVRIIHIVPCHIDSMVH